MVSQATFIIILICLFTSCFLVIQFSLSLSLLLLDLSGSGTMEKIWVQVAVQEMKKQWTRFKDIWTKINRTHVWTLTYIYWKLTVVSGAALFNNCINYAITWTAFIWRNTIYCLPKLYWPTAEGWSVDSTLCSPLKPPEIKIKLLMPNLSI